MMNGFANARRLSEEAHDGAAEGGLSPGADNRDSLQVIARQLKWDRFGLYLRTTTPAICCDLRGQTAR